MANVRTPVIYLLSATLEACAQILTFVCYHKSGRLALHRSIEAYSFKTHPPPFACMLDSCKLTFINNCEYGSARGQGVPLRVPYMWGFICASAVSIMWMRCTMHSNKLSSTYTSSSRKGKRYSIRCRYFGPRCQIVRCIVS